MSSDLNEITRVTIAGAIAVHHELWPRLLEHAYEACVTFELLSRGLTIERQKALPIVYKGQHLNCGYRIDLLVEELVIVEIKSIERLDVERVVNGFEE